MAPRTLSILAAAALATSLAACAPQSTGSGASPAPSGRGCSKDQLKTLHAGKLTIGTDNPAYPPWFVDNKPDNGTGYESAVAYAVADKLGYAPGDVAWSQVTFNNAIQPGPKSYDFDVNQFSITDERRNAVDCPARTTTCIKRSSR
jgi:polar amino acid transport system substrate-binding protein